MTTGQRALLVGAVLAAVGWALHAAGAGLPLLMAALAIGLLLTWVLPHLGLRALDRLEHALRAAKWRREEGRHHAFGGTHLHIHDDGRHCWMTASDLRHLLQLREADDVIAARLSGRWRRDARGVLLLRVDAVARYLADAPGRMDPRTVRLRRYLDQDVLFPAAQRRRMSLPADRDTPPGGPDTR